MNVKQLPGLRLYSFINYYLSSIAQGIQTHHAAQEMMNKYVFCYNEKPHLNTIIREWSMVHKTDVLLNGGDNENMQNICLFLESNPLLNLPWAEFHEDEESLGGILTAIAIIVPENMYDAVNYRNAVNKDPQPAEFVERFPSKEFSDSWFYQHKDKINHAVTIEECWTIHDQNSVAGKFITIMKSCPLAR